MSSRLALGTVQFGLRYGVANARGQVPAEEAAEIVSCARERGIDTLDTAIAYGESEFRLGQIGVGGWRVVSKLPAIPEDCRDVRGWVEKCVTASLERLKIASLYGLLVHRAWDLGRPKGDEIYSSMERLRSSGVVRRIGASIYDTEDLEGFAGRFTFDLIQVPFNVFDRRIHTSGWLTRFKAQGTEVHTRSAFLQGLLLLPPHRRPRKFDRWKPLWAAWDGWLAESKLTPSVACLGFSLRHSEIDRVVVGVDDAAQLRALLEAEVPLAMELPGELTSDDLDLINPSHWSTL